MKIRFAYFSILLIIIYFTGCKPKVAIVETIELPVEDTVPVYFDKSRMFYSSDVLYVIGREYEELSDSTSAKFNSPERQKLMANGKLMPLTEYVEKRLIELYPQKAFRGMFEGFDLNKLAQSSTTDPEIFITGMDEFTLTDNKSNSFNEPFYYFVSVEDEITFLNMTEKEKEKYLALNNLAVSPDFATRNDFEEISKKDSIPDDLTEEDTMFLLEENVFLSCALLVGGAPYVFYRVKQSKERAYHEAKKYYNDDTSCGKKGDAFKHIYVNMLLRRYLTEGLSYLVMDVFWENQGSNSPCDRHMDLHNNYVGRSSKYYQFRGNMFQNDWKKWSYSIHEFVENDRNSIEKPWHKQLMEYVIIEDKKDLDKSKYVFWNKTSECE